MKKIDIKSLILGLLIGMLSVGVVSGATIKIKSAQYNETKVIYNGEELQLSQPMISVINENSQNASNYMPVRAVLEAMDYKVDWDGKENAVIISNITDNENDINDSVKYTQEEYNELINLFTVQEWVLNDAPSPKFQKYYKNAMVYDGSLSYSEFVDFFNNYPNKDKIIIDFFNEIKIETEFNMLLDFQHKNNDILRSIGGVSRNTNGIIQINYK